jgi:hypothetical protein
MIKYTLRFNQESDGKLAILELHLKEEAMIYDIVVSNEWENKDGVEQSVLRNVGTAFDLKNGGKRCMPFTRVSIGGEFLLLPRRKKAAGVEEIADTGDDFLE